MLIGIVGKLGSGKTLLLVYIMSIAKRNNYFVVSNFKCTYADLVLSAEEMILKMEDFAKTHDKILFSIDELGGVMKATDFLSSANTIMCDIAMKSRKLKTEIIYSSQDIRMVDRTVRRITDIITLVKYKEKKDQKGNIIRAEVHSSPLEQDFFGFSVGRPFVINAMKYFDKYDTTEIIRPNKDAIIEYLYKKLLENKLLIEMIAQSSKRNIQASFVKDYMNITRPTATLLCGLFHLRKSATIEA